jgi:hypothetical protein
MTISESLYNTVPATALTIGMCATMGGIQDLSAGAISRGAAKTLAGLTVVRIGSEILGLPHALGMQSSLVAGSCLAALQGPFKLVNGIKERNLFQILQGTAQATIGYVAANFFYSLPSEFTSEPIPVELETFLHDHDSEIAKIYQSKISFGSSTILGDWEYIGSGMSKSVYTHPQLQYVVKIPHFESSAWSHAENDVVVEHKNAQKARLLIAANGWNRLRVPESYLINSNSGPFVVESKLEFIPYWDVPESSEKKEARSQLADFLQKGGYCDIGIYHNARFLQSNPADPKIGIYDLDCVDKKDDKNPASPNVEAFAKAGPILIALAEKTTRLMLGEGKANLLGISVLSAIGLGTIAMSSTPIPYVAAAVVGAGMGLVSGCHKINGIWKRASVSQ